MGLSTCPASCEELLARMVAHNTVNPRFGGPGDGEARLIEFLEELAQAWGLTSRRTRVAGNRENLLIECPATTPAARRLIFESHLDTVTAEGMRIDPFRLDAVGPRLFGRGSCDTKGSGAAMLWALRNHAQSAVRPREVAVLFTVDEEASMAGSRSFARNELPALRHTLDGVIVGEPTLLQPVVAHNGVIRWKTITRGRAAHSSVPANGRSAISAMLPVIQALESRYASSVNESHPLTGHAAFSVNVVRGGTQVNVIPDACEIECDRRTVPGESAAQVLAERDAVMAGFAVEHEALYVVPPLEDQRASLLYRQVHRVLDQAGLAVTPIGAAYVTNASQYAAAGVPTVVLGPGDIAQAHTSDEWIARDQLARAVAVYQALMEQAV